MMQPITISPRPSFQQTLQAAAETLQQLAHGSEQAGKHEEAEHEREIARQVESIANRPAR